MRSKITLLILILLLGIKVFSQQERLNKTFICGNNNFINTIFLTDSGYVLGCWYDNSIVFIDSSTNTKWIKSYPYIPYSSGFDMASNALHKSIEGNYYAGGTIQNDVATVNKVYMIRYSSKFDTLNRKILLVDSTYCNGCLHVYNSLKNSNGNYVFIGMHTKDSANMPLNYGKGLFLIADSNGILKNRKVLGLNNDDSWLISGLQMGNYYYLFGATRCYAPPNDPYDRTDGWVVKTDLQGNEIASQNYGNPNLYDEEFKYALPLPNNKIMVGHFYCYQKTSNGILMGKPWLLILNENLGVEKEFFFRDASVSGDTLFSMGNRQVIFGNDSSFAILGGKSAYNTNTFEVIWIRSMITKLDKNYKVRFSRDYVHNGGIFNNINPIVITSTSDGGYLFGGYVVDNTLTPIQQSWLVKTDSLGCDGLQSCNDTALVINVTQVPDTICKNDTVWIPVTFKGRSAPYFIYANNTLALDSVYYPYTLPLWIDTLMPYIPHDSGIQQIIIKIKDPWGWQQSDTIQTYVKNCHQSFASEAFYKYKIEIYPNPVTNEVHVRIRGVLSGEYTVTLYDMHGKPVQKVITSEPETVLDVSQLPQGIYTIRVLGNNMVRSERVVKLSGP